MAAPLAVGAALLAGVRDQVGADFPIIVRMNATDYVEGGLELPDTLHESDLEVYVIGDAVEPRKALAAIHAGFEVGNKV